MQIISVERWTFWTGFAIVFLGFAFDGVTYTTYASGTTTWNVGPWVILLGFALLAISVGLGNSCDPSVRRLASQSDS